MEMEDKKNELSENGGESENSRIEKEKQVQASLDIIVSKHRNRKKLSLNETVESVCAGQPEAIAAKVMRTCDRVQSWTNKFKSYGVPEELLQGHVKQEVEIEARETQSSYIDKGIEMPNKELGKLETTRALGEILDNEPKIDDLKRVARVSFDLNGLKVVNDYSGVYANGDLYLKLMKKALENRDIRQWARDNKFSYTACREGGDEFSAIIASEIPLTEETLNTFIEKVTDLLENDSEAEKCLNMFDDDTLLRWKHKVPAEEGRNLKIAQLRAGGREISDDYKFSPEEKIDADRLGEEWKAKALVEYRKDVPPDFKFKGRVAASAATVYDGLMDDRNKEKRIINEDDNYEDALMKMKDCPYATGDRDMHDNKVNGKHKMSVSNDPNELFLFKLYNSTRSAEQDEQLGKEKMLTAALTVLNFLKDERNILKSTLLAIYEFDNISDRDKVIVENKLATRIKDEQIREAEEKVKRLKK
jgi:hypothetical protein